MELAGPGARAGAPPFLVTRANHVKRPLVLSNRINPGDDFLERGATQVRVRVERDRYLGHRARE